MLRYGAILNVSDILTLNYYFRVKRTERKHFGCVWTKTSAITQNHILFYQRHQNTPAVKKSILLEMKLART